MDTRATLEDMLEAAAGCFLSPQGISELLGELAAGEAGCFLSPHGILSESSESGELSAIAIADCFLSPQGISGVEETTVGPVASSNSSSEQ